MEKFIIWFSVEKSRAMAVVSGLIGKVRSFFETAFMKRILDSIWHAAAAVLVFKLVIVVFGIIFPPMLIFAYLLAYPMIILTFLVLFVLVFWLSPSISKMVDIATTVAAAYVGSKKK